MKTVRIRGRVGDGRTHSTDQARWLDQRLQLDLYDIIIHYIGKKSSEYAASSNTASTSFPPFCPVFFAAISWSAIMSTHLRTSRPIFRQLTSDPSEILWQLLLGSQRYPSGFLRTLSLSLSSPQDSSRASWLFWTFLFRLFENPILDVREGHRWEGGGGKRGQGFIPIYFMMFVFSFLILNSKKEILRSL